MEQKVGLIENKMSENIISVVASYFGITPEELQKKTRRANIVHARQICTFLIRKYTRISKLSLGRVYFNQDHSTVIHSLRLIEEEATHNIRGTRKDLENICNIIEGKAPAFKSKIKTKFCVLLRCDDMKDEYYGFWDNSDEANVCLQDRIKSLVGKKKDRCVQSTMIKVKMINNA